ncbi:hypothetical protein DFH09DRAFT_59082 [Mycena vulgaris]|nr:hypothetical protein DFH09DRAFT_59082 [Mycena vulgaris]
MWILPLLNLVLASWLVSAAQNYTIDDASPLVIYDAPVLERNITAFDSRLLRDGTITYIAPTPNASPTISINFTGTAIYIYVAYPGHSEPAPSGFTARIDGADAGGWAAAESALLYRHLVYHSAVLPDARHTLVMQIQPKWELYFDYAMYTSSDTDPAASSASDAAPSQQPTAGRASPTTSGVSPNAGGTSPNLNPKAKNPPLGAIVGAIIGSMLLIALGGTVWFLRRRWRASTKCALIPFPAGVRIDDEASEKDGAPPPATPFLLRGPRPARSSKS